MNIFKSVLVLVLIFIMADASAANAQSCRVAGKYGFGFVDKNTLVCNTERNNGATCYRSQFKDQENFVYTSICRLDGNYRWRHSPPDADFRVKTNILTNYAVKLDGRACFHANLYNDRQHTYIYFCDYKRTTDFNEGSLKSVLKKAKSFGSRKNQLKQWPSD